VTTTAGRGWDDRPAVARRFLDHAIGPHASPATSARIRMHGEIKLKTWRPFGADETLAWDREMIWRARTSMNGIPISGHDRVAAGTGEMRWKILGLFPVIRTSGNDIARSGAGRVAGEAIWIPSVLASRDVAWTGVNDRHARASLTVFGERVDLAMTIGTDGRLEQIVYPRWGNPEGGLFHYADFGGVIEAEGSYQGFTIPTRMRMGWYFGTDRFEREGEFIRITIDGARYE
jgi:uncharacterized protein DUF6920